MEIIPFSLTASFFTCVSGTLANAAYAGWPDPLPKLMLRIAIGYAGAILVVVLLLPLLHSARNSRNDNT